MKQRKLTKKMQDRMSGMEMNLTVRSFDSPLSPEVFSEQQKLPVTVILDNLRSAFNVGSVVRSADCIRAEKVIFTGYTAHPPHQKLEKTSLGAIPYVPWEYEEQPESAIIQLKEKGIPVIALETTNQSKTLWDYQFSLPVGLILGNEALGVSKDILKMADDIVEIPMMGFKNSINVAVAFGIVAHEIQRQHWHYVQSRLLNSGGLNE